MTTMAVKVNNLVKEFQGKKSGGTAAISSLSFTVELGTFVTFVGPSGCGKTTLLKCLAGLIAPTSGEIIWNGDPVAGQPHNVVLVFQDYTKALLPWRTVFKNTVFPIEGRGQSRECEEELAQMILERVGLSDFRDHYPWQLSGGMQQKVQIARALVYRPSVLLLDEPFASLDTLTRTKMHDELLWLWKEFSMTILMVTHNIEEAVYLSDRVIALARPARILEDLPIEFPRPRSQADTKLLRDYWIYCTKLYDTLSIATYETSF